MKQATRTISDRGNVKTSLFEKISYGMGDVACNVVFALTSGLVTYFYTNVMSVSAGLVGMIMLLSRFFDGFSDLAIGVIMDKVHSKHGRGRAWVLWMTIPYGVTAVALFCLPPQATGIAQALYIFVTYNLCTTVVYTALNLPYATMAPLMTRDENDLAKINLFRMSMSPIGNLIVSAVTLPLINRMGGDQAAWIKVMSVWAVLALALLLLCFFRCEEKVQIEARKKDEKLPIPTMLKALFANQYFWAVMLLWTVQSVSFTITGTILPYYCKYIFNNDTWMYSALFLTETLVLVVGIFICSPLIKKFGKRNIAFVGGFVALGGQILFFLNPYSFGFMVMSCVTRAIGLAPLNAVVFSMVGDVVEFGQWKNHIRQESLIFAGGSIGTKVGAGLASAVITGLLSSSGYVSSSAGITAQPETALEMIVSLYKFGPILIAAVIIVTLFGYKLDKMYPAIMQELTEREAHGQL